MAKRKYTESEVKAEISLWGKEPTLVTSDSHTQTTVLNRKLAIDMYSEGYKVNEIVARTGIDRSRITKMIDRCMTHDEEGKPFGYRALYPYVRLKTPGTVKIQSLIDQYPGLEKQLLDFFFSASSGRPFKRVDKNTTFKLFLTELENRGHDTSAYPFCLSDAGQRNFYKWIDAKEQEKNLYRARMKEEARIEDKKTGVEDRLMRPVRPYQLVEIDGHRLDLIYIVEAYDAEGKPIAIPVERPWLLAAIDVATRCIVGYRLVFETEYSSVDVLKLLESITAPYNGLPGVREDAMPQQVLKQAKYALPEIVYMDNALAHYADKILNLTTEYGYHFVYGPVADPTKRPFIERFFGTFERRWGHKVPTTTGSNPGDLVRIKAEEDAVKFRFDRESVERLVALAIGTYNNTIHRGIENMTPIGKMRQLFSQGYLANRLAYPLRDSFKLNYKQRATIRGNKNTGKQVYLQMNNYTYKNDYYKSQYAWVGKEVTVVIDPDDITTVHVYADNDVDLDVWRIKGYYKSDTVGSVSLRHSKLVQKYLRENGITRNHGLDDVEKYLLEIKKNPGTKTNIRNIENITLAADITTLPDSLDSANQDAEIDIATSSDGFFAAKENEEKESIFDDRPEEEKIKALRGKYKHLYEGGKD